MKTILETAEPVPVGDRIAELLETSGRTDGGVIIGFTFRALAAGVYEVEDPSAAQLSAVRAAVADLIAASRGISLAEPWVNSQQASRLPWLVDLPPQRHEQRGTHGATYRYANPGGTVIFRAPTADDLGAWPELEAASEAPPAGHPGEASRAVVAPADRTEVSNDHRETSVRGWTG